MILVHKQNVMSCLYSFKLLGKPWFPQVLHKGALKVLFFAATVQKHIYKHDTDFIVA